MSGLPSELEPLFRELQIEIAWLHGRWQIYRQLFGHSQIRIDLLNDCAPAFFDAVHNILINDVQMTLSKLTDAASTCGNDNLSLEQVQLRISTQDPEFAVISESALKCLQAMCTPFRTRRHKRIAHFDLPTCLGSSENLPLVSRTMVEDALLKAREYMNLIQRHYEDVDTAYEHFTMIGDGEALASMLQDGLSYRALKKIGVFAATSG